MVDPLRRDDDVPLPDLLRGARDVYRRAVRRALSGTGHDDLPRHAVFVLAGLDHGAGERPFSAQGDVVANLGMSKQAASQLIDTLVLREYLERRSDPVDRRRMEIRLTDRGRGAATAIHAAIGDVDAAVTRSISRDELQGMRAGLAAYRLIGEASGG